MRVFDRRAEGRGDTRAVGTRSAAACRRRARGVDRFALTRLFAEKRSEQVVGREYRRIMNGLGAYDKYLIAMTGVKCNVTRRPHA
jgi:hypothetical protein